MHGVDRCGVDPFLRNKPFVTTMPNQQQETANAKQAVDCYFLSQPFSRTTLAPHVSRHGQETSTDVRGPTHLQNLEERVYAGTVSSLGTPCRFCPNMAGRCNVKTMESSRLGGPPLERGLSNARTVACTMIASHPRPGRWDLSSV